MNQILDEQQRLLKDSAQSFIRERMPVGHLRALASRSPAQGHDPKLWRAFADQGYSATLVPESHEGIGLDVAEAGLIAEQIGHTLAPTPFFSTAVLAAWLLREAASPVLQGQWLPRIASADAVVTLAVDEGGRHRPDRIETRATAEPDGWRVDGAKTLVLDGCEADAWIVSARTDDATVLLMVARGTAGVDVDRMDLVDGHSAARVTFTGVRVDGGMRIGGENQGAALLERVLDVGRVVAAAELLGVADEVFQRTVDYLRERKQFGRLIGEFQALQHRAAELFCDLELTRAIVRQGLQSVEQGTHDVRLRASQAKARASLTADRAVQEAVQMHGGVGMTDELDIGLFMKRARVLQELLGDASFHADRVALLNGY